MATQADIQNWRQAVYTQQYSLSNALTNYNLAPTNLSKKEKKLEVLLFRAMMDYFDYHPSPLAAVVYTDETHQHYVFPWGINGYCEISDVLFIVFSSKNKTLRMTHLQAKRKKITQKVSLPINNSIFEFAIDPKQYCLLNWRLPFSNRGNSHYPIGTFFCPEFSDSITSYGVFYLSQNNDWNIAYEVASLVISPSLKKGVFYDVNDIHGYKNELYFINYPTPQAWENVYKKADNSLPQRELLSTLKTALFEEELIHCHVGSIIRGGTSMGDALLSFVAGMFNARYNNLSPQQQDVVNTFNEYLINNELNVQDQQFDDSVLPINIVLINADMANMRE